VPVAGNLTNSTLGSELAINITDGKLFYKDNADAVQVIGWKTVPTTAGGTGLTTYIAGDLSYYASGTTFTKLAIGTNGQILTSTGSAPQWSTLSGVAVTTFNAGTTGFTPNSATSGAITLAGTLITSNGGTGLSSYTAGDLSYYASGTTFTKLAIGATGRFLSSTGSAPQWSAPAALTETDDTNVTMTLGGTPSTALLTSVSMTLGWTGTLAVSRGGTGAGTASITSFNNITGYTASGATGTTSANLVFSTSPSITTPTLVGDVTVSTGNLVIGTSGKGIDFSATPGTGTSELLADYEEGTWTPVFSATTAPTSVTYTARSGYYIKIGKKVTLWFEVSINSAGSGGSGDLKVEGMPYTTANANPRGGMYFHYANGPANAKKFAGYIPANSTFALGDSGGTGITWADIGGGTLYMGTMEYYTA
jgi:hypothetical protein